MTLYSAKQLSQTINSNSQKMVPKHKKSTYGCFRIGPFKGTKSLTFANLIRRTLLTEVPGTAITEAIFPYATHEFATVPGIQESVIDIILNLKQVVIEGYCANYTRATISKKGPTIITAKDLNLPYPLTVPFPEQIIAHVNAGFSFNIDCIIKTGKGSTLPLLKKSVGPSSSVLIQNDFSPIKKVNYTICEERLKEWVEFEIWTNGSIKPYIALQTAVYTVLQELKFLYPKTLELTKTTLPLLNSDLKNSQKIENCFFPLDLYKGLRCSQVTTTTHLIKEKDWSTFSNKYQVSVDLLNEFLI